MTLHYPIDNHDSDMAEARSVTATDLLPTPVTPKMKLSLSEIRATLEPLIESYGPILTLKEAAKLARLSPNTLKRLVIPACFQH